MLASPAFSDSELLVADESHYSLSRQFAVFQHRGVALELEEALARSAAGEFRPINANSVASTNFGLTRSEVWLEQSFVTAAELPARWLLEVAHASLDQVDLFIAAGEGPFEHQRAGDLLPFADKALPHRHHLFELQLQPNTRYRLFLHVRSEGTLSVPVTLWQPDALWANDQLSYSFLSLYYGLLAGLMIYNFFLFLALRDRLYIIYVAFVALLALGQAGLAGLTGQFLWPHNALLTHLSPTAGVSLAGVFGALFVQRFLGSTPRSLRLHWLMPLLGLVYGLIFLCTLFGSYFLAALTVNFTSLVFALSALLLGALACYQRQPGARLFVLAWISLLSSIVVIALHNLGVLPSNAFLEGFWGASGYARVDVRAYQGLRSLDDTAVTPQYVRDVEPSRELPIIRRIATGSLGNKAIIIVFALLLSQFVPWILTPLLMLGGVYLCYEGAEKVWERVSGHHEEATPVVEKGPDAEKRMVRGAVTTDFILSAEIMMIALNEVADEPFWTRAAILVVVGL
ncbi:MAG: DUF808 family protein, partial [Pseudomonas sp.]